MRRVLFLVTLLCVSIPSFAAENEFRLGVTTASRWSDNAANVSEGKEDAFSFAIGPLIQFDSSASQYEAGFTYIPRFVYYTDARDDDVSHVFGAHADYRPNKRLTFRARNLLRLEFDSDRDYTSIDEPSLDSDGDKQTLRNRFNFNAQYAFTPRLSLDTNFSSVYVSREDKDLSDSHQLGGRIQLQYVMSPKDSIGFGVFARNQEADGGINRLGERVGDTTTDSDGLTLSWKHMFSPLLSAHAAGGPTWVTSNRAGDGRSSTTDLEYFANAGVEAEYDNGKASLIYIRSGAEYTRTSTTYLVDTVRARASIRLNRKLTLGVLGQWSENKAILKQEGDSVEDDVKQWLIAGTATYRFTPEFTTHFTLDYLRQDTSIDSPSDRFRVVIRLDYHARTFAF